MRNWRSRAVHFLKHLLDQNLRFFNPIYDLTLKFMPYRKPALDLQLYQLLSDCWSYR